MVIIRVSGRVEIQEMVKVAVELVVEAARKFQMVRTKEIQLTRLGVNHLVGVSSKSKEK